MIKGGANGSPPTGAGPRVLSPERLTRQHDVSTFRNGKHPSLDVWLRDRAQASESLSARTYVVCDAEAPLRVVGYYAISTAMEQRTALPNARLRRGMPDQVPLLLLGRLAIDQAFQGSGLGSALLADAMRRCIAAADVAGARGIVAHALDDDAVRFYQHRGFLPLTAGTRTMFLPMETARRLIGLAPAPES